MKVDFSAIAKEKITLVHVGDKLIILFDNQSTITVEPFFDSRADGNVTIEMAPGRDVSVQEFAGLFPIGTDSSVLPAADNGGNSNGNAQASGANFSPFTIDALDPVGTNVLAGPEPLPNFVTPPQTGPFVLQQPAVVAPTIVVNSIASLTLSEANLTAATNGVDGSTHNLALTHVTGNFAVDFADKAGSTGISSVSYALSIPANGTLSGLIDSQSHQNDVLVQVNATTIEGHVGSATGALAFTISVNPATGVVTFTEDRAVDNNAGPVSLAAGTVTLTQTVVDSDGGKASASVDLGPKLSISDDHPTASPDTATAQDGGPAVTVLTGNVASVIGNDLSGADTPINVTAVVATSNGNLAGTVGTALTGEFGKLTLNADGTFSYTANHNVLVGSKDVFTYTITDDDGTTSSTTLTITIAAGQGPVAGSDSSLSVNESALAPNGSGAHLTPDVATTQVSFTAGADDLHVTLNASALTTLLAGFPNLVWTTAAGGQEIVGTQNGVTVVKFDITAGATIAAGTSGQVTVTETLLAAIDNAFAEIVPARWATRANTTRQFKVFNDARAILAGDVAHPIYSGELANQIGVSVRTLHDAIQRYRGVSLHRYLRLRRLWLVRKQLLAGAPSVKACALAYGFWHLSDFSRSYRSQFGEAPSETLAASRARPDSSSGRHES